MVDAFIGTETGVFHLHADRLSPLGLSEHQVSALHAVPRDDGSAILLAGTYGAGLFRSEDAGAHWDQVSDGLTTPVFRSITADPTMPGALLCGTEPARIFRSRDDGLTWESLGVETHEDVESWYLPYSPRAGAVRNIFGPPGTQRLLGALEVGGLLDRSDADGDAWACGTILGNGDIHYINGHPHDPAYLVAALGWAEAKKHPHGPDDPPMGGVGVSQDGGRTWRASHSDYTRAVIIPPTRPDLLLAGPAKRVGGRGRIDVSDDAGLTWQPASNGIETPMDDMVECFLPAPDGTIWAICDGGRLLAAEPGDWHWRSVVPENAGVHVRSVAIVV
jgi:hypothetical protein